MGENLRTFLRFPNFKQKAVTLSYDDGVRQDKRLIAIMQKYGIKGTFNINAGLFAKELSDVQKGRMTKEEAIELYTNSGMEVAVHGYRHLSLAEVDPALATDDVLKDRKELESIFGGIIKGMAYANGSYSDGVCEILRSCGINYSRTTVTTEKFKIPTNWLKLETTCHHNNPKLMELAKIFVDTKEDGYVWRNYPRLFYLWGHSYEFDTNDNWNVIEEFCEYIGGKDDTWYATNGEIYSYVKAFDSLEFSADGNTIYNPSGITVYICYLGKHIAIQPNETKNIND